ncbi:hypothetical protein B4Q04_08815 [Zobellia sp. OII3]|uniref:DUF6630 family protein n=1 Tax=Zobellia sp. OII3 TaxID=2034520 RepID=UPI000B53148E|nr:hypothetical protein [Zobellia sp. OII3]OWW25695.1 hypothetical protein B4Q04_08815 [Zobellia sp. OII3]
MGIFNFFKKSKKSNNLETKAESLEINTENIKGLASLALKDNDAEKIINKLAELSKNTDNEFIDEGHLFTSMELYDYMCEEDIYMYGYFDWREESENFDRFIKIALDKNFSLKLEEPHICDLNELGTIGLVYRLYGRVLEKKGITLCAINTLSDSYTIMLVETDSYKLFENFVNNLTEYEPLHFSQEWPV